MPEFGPTADSPVSFKALYHNTLTSIGPFGNGPCQLLRAKSGVSSVLAGQGKRRGRATQGLRSLFWSILLAPAYRVGTRFHAGGSPHKKPHILAICERPEGPGRSALWDTSQMGGRRISNIEYRTPICEVRIEPTNIGLRRRIPNAEMTVVGRAQTFYIGIRYSMLRLQPFA